MHYITSISEHCRYFLVNNPPKNPMVQKNIKKFHKKYLNVNIREKSKRVHVFMFFLIGILEK